MTSNIALKVLLQHREEDRIQIEAKALANVSTLVLPYVQKLFDIPYPFTGKGTIGDKDY